MIDLVLELENLLELLLVPVAVLVGFYLVGRHAVPVRLALAILVVGTATLAFLAYRLYRSQVEYCEDSYEVRTGGDELSCLEPGNWFAFNLALLTLLIAELGLALLLTGSFVRWRRLQASPGISAGPPTY